LRASLAWLRLGGVALTGAAVVACSTSAAVTGASAAPHRSTPAAQPSGAASTGTGGAGVAGTGTGTGGSSGSDPTPAQAEASRAAAQAASLSPAQLAGQRVIYSYTGHAPPAALLNLIRRGEVAGVIFFSGNISSHVQIAGVIRRLEQADAASTNPVRSPLLLMTDQEGGLVRRLTGAPTLSEKQIGAAAHPAAQASNAGQTAAANLRSVGMNVNLAPVLDVYRAPGDFDDQFQRSYSMNPRSVSALGADFIKAQQKGGVAATAKHFPGLGAATAKQDTDLKPVTLHVSRANLHGIDEYPYTAAIKAKVKLVMVSWAVYPSLGARPAGLSSNIVQAELRERLDFTGVTITDALEAGALKPYGSIQNRALLAAKAGMDLLLCSDQTTTEGSHCLDGLMTGYKDGSLPKAAFQAAAARVLALRAGLPR
jgi:beta-N-acetylhexosaminidase